MADDSGAMANGSYVENFESVTATDEHTVEIKLKEPSASMLAIDIPIVPQHVWESVGNIADFSNEESYPIVGNGPWILTDYKRNESITLEANKDYWRGAPGFDRLIFRFYKDQDAVVEALRKGEVYVRQRPHRTPGRRRWRARTTSTSTTPWASASRA